MRCGQIANAARCEQLGGARTPSHSPRPTRAALARELGAGHAGVVGDDEARHELAAPRRVRDAVVPADARTPGRRPGCPYYIAHEGGDREDAREGRLCHGNFEFSKLIWGRYGPFRGLWPHSIPQN